MTIPNILSIFRIVLIPIYAWLYFSDFESGAVIAGMVLVNNPGDWGHLYP